MILNLLIGFSATFLLGCEKRLQTITVTQTLNPPDALLQPCPKPSANRLETNEDLIKFASDAVYKWEVCAAQISGLRVFFGLDMEEQNLVDEASIRGEPH